MEKKYLEMSKNLGKNQQMAYCRECGSAEFSSDSSYVSYGGRSYHRKCLNKLMKGHDFKKYAKIPKEFIEAGFVLDELGSFEFEWCLVSGQHKGCYHFKVFEYKKELVEYIREECRLGNDDINNLLLITHRMEPVLFEVKKTVEISIED